MNSSDEGSKLQGDAISSGVSHVIDVDDDFIVNKSDGISHLHGTNLKSDHVDPLDDHLANSKTQSPNPDMVHSMPQSSPVSQQELRQNSVLIPVSEDKNLDPETSNPDTSSKISAYARLDFDNFTFFVQTLQVILGRKSNIDVDLQSNHHAVDVHLSSKKAVSRRHARIFYNFASQQFELSVLGRNGAFVDDMFVEKGITVPLNDGSKIQIGDIPFVFVLPSIEVHEVIRTDSKQFNPTDAVNLRSNLYSSKSPTPKVSPKKPIEEKKKLLERSEVEFKHPKSPTGGRKSFSKSTRDSLLKIRRLSNARRKSLASVAGDELNDILKELGVSSIDAIDENDPDLLDSQIQGILDDHENNGTGSNIESSLMKLAQFNEMAIEEEEDEIDRLVKQHNLQQGVNLDESDMMDDGELEAIEMDLSVLDKEIANLAPLIDEHNQSLLKEKEEQRRTLQQRKELTQLQQQRNITKFNSGFPGQRQHFSTSTLANTDPLLIQASSSNQAIGKPAAPRMGKPASIQPPASRLYNRSLNGLSNNQLLDNRLLSTSKLSGLPTHLLGLQSLNLSHSLPYNTLGKSGLPARPPPPKLEVPVLTITAEPSTIRFRPPLRAITTNNDPPLSSFGVPTTNDEPSKYPKLPISRRDITRRPPKKIYALDEIPEQYRAKPSASLPAMITNVLKPKSTTGGLTLNEIYDAIKDMYPYYNYCPDGWQFSVAHNVKYNKIFKRLSKKGDEWSYIMDELYINEREKVRTKQQEIIASRAKMAAIKAEELKQKQRLEVQQALSQNIAGRNFLSPYGLSSSNLYKTGSQFVPNNIPYKPTTSTAPVPGQKQKTIAELASEIRRDGIINSNAPLYFKPHQSGTSPTSNQSATVAPEDNIKAQLAANRSASPQVTNTTSRSSTPPQANMSQDTKNSLTYLQKELFTLYKARKLSYNTAVTTEIITKALATTIAQVNAIGAKAGCGDNALSFLVERAPQQVSKILDIALTKSIREKESGKSSGTPSRSGTPGPPGPTQVPVTAPSSSSLVHNSPTKIQLAPSAPSALPANIVRSKELSSEMSVGQNGLTPILTGDETKTALAPEIQTAPEVPSARALAPQLATPIINSSTSTTNTPTKTAHPPSAHPPPTTTTTHTATPTKPMALSKPPNYGLSKPSSFQSLGRPSPLSKPSSFNKPGALSRPPQFLSNKLPTTPQASNVSANANNKREIDSAQESPRKIIKTD
jgi:pSer/pThr/pTyr-binding forkhead associated (FHA) protein